MESSSQDALANTRLGLHFKWCKYLMPSEVISRMESPSQDALASLAIKVQLSFFLYSG
jgi:hypothetical protein